MSDPAKADKAAASTEVAADERLVRALKHPLRLELLRRFAERTATPNELAKELDEPVGNVAYHVRDLVAVGYLELVRTEPRRGAVAHYYRATIRPNVPSAEWERLDPEVRAQMSSRTLQNMFGEVVAALRSGTMDSRLDRYLGWRFLSLDEEGWTAVNEAIEGAVERIEEIEAESANRRADSGEASISAIAALMAFERSP